MGQPVLLGFEATCSADVTWPETLFDKEHYLQRPIRSRLAFREFGTILGIQCNVSEPSLRQSAEVLLTEWEKHMETQTPDDLRPITLVMYAAALVPGGKRRLTGRRNHLRYTDF